MTSNLATRRRPRATSSRAPKAAAGFALSATLIFSLLMGSGGAAIGSTEVEGVEPQQVVEETTDATSTPEDSVSPSPSPSPTPTAQDSSLPSEEAKEELPVPTPSASELSPSDLQSDSLQGDQTILELDEGSIAPAAVGPLPSGHARIVVQVGGDRQPDDSIKGLSGVVLKLHRNDPSGIGGTVAYPWATCTSDSDGECVFTIPVAGQANSMSEDTRFWVKQFSAPTGWYSSPSLRTGSSSAALDANSVYIFLTGTQLRSGQTYLSTAPLPAADRPFVDRGFMRNAKTKIDASDEGVERNRNRTLGIWNQSRDNNSLPPQCGLDVALVVDTSGSLGTQGMTDTKTALDTIVAGFQGTPSALSLFSFSDSSPGGGGSNHPALLPVATPAQAQVFKAQYANWAPGGGTNWDRGLAEAANAGNDYDLVVLLTDGNPTVEGPTIGYYESTYNAFREVDAGTFSANQLKALGSRVVAVGVGPALTTTSELNLRAISGQTKNSDYFHTPDFAAAAKIISDMAKANCQGSIQVQKMLVPFGGSVSDAVDPGVGWEFEATSLNTDKVAVVVPPETKTDEDGQVTFGLNFTDPYLDGRIQLQETQQAGYTHVPVNGRNAVCTDLTDNSTVAVTNAGTTAKPGFTVNSKAKSQIFCTIYNQQPPAATLTLKKHVVARVKGSDQFTLSVKQGATTLGTVTTQGSSLGVQTETVDRVAVKPGQTYGIAETTPPGYTSTYACSSAGAQILTGNGTTADIKIPNVPGAHVECIFTNTPNGKITIKKVDQEDTSKTLAGAVFQLWLDTNGNGLLDAGDTKVGDELTTPANGLLSWDKQLWGKYLVEEISPPPGYELSDPSVWAISLDKGVIEKEIENSRVSGEVVWVKVDATDEKNRLAGSEWKLTGPSPATTAVTITDCIRATAADCETVLDKDHTAGGFKLIGLAWGDYTLTETVAPPGYELDATPREFAIGKKNSQAEIVLEINLGPIKNKQQDGLTIPLTGGLGSQAFLIGGSAILLGAAGLYLWRQRRQAQLLS